MVINIMYLLALAGYFFCLYEYIAMRHRDICTESDIQILLKYDGWVFEKWPELKLKNRAASLYWNRGTK